MSAYRASPPVEQRITSDSTIKAEKPFSRKNRMAWWGLTAPSIEGIFARDAMPVTNRVANHRTITGPKTPATLSVPLYCIMNRTTVIILAMRVRVP